MGGAELVVNEFYTFYLVHGLQIPGKWLGIAKDYFIIENLRGKQAFFPTEQFVLANGMSETEIESARLQLDAADRTRAEAALAEKGFLN